MRMRRGTAAALLVVLAACARCAHPAGAPAERFIPRDAALVAVVPSLRTAQAQLASIVSTASTFAAAADQVQALTAVKEQLGFDPLDPRGLEGVGIDAGRGAAVAVPRDGPPLLVLPVRDEDKVRSLVARLARDRLGAGTSDDVKAGGHAVTAYRRAAGAPPAVSIAFAEGNALLVVGPDGPARVAAALASTQAESILGAPAYVRALAAIGATSALVAFVPPGSPRWTGVPLLRDGAALGVTGSATRLALRGVLLLEPERRAWWRSTVDPGPAPDTAAPGLMPADSFAVARFEGDVATVVRRTLPSGEIQAALRKAGIDLERDVLGLLSRGGVASLAVAPTFQVGTAARADLVARDPFELVHLAAVLHVGDPAAARALLDRLVRAAPRLGIRVARAPTGPTRWRLQRGRGVLELALDGNRLLVGGGAGRLDALLAAKERYAPPTDAARAALSTGVAGGVVDFERLVASFRALPPQAYGTGPDAFVMRSLADRVIDPASRLVAASARLELREDAAAVDVTLEAKQPAPTSAGGAAR